MNPVPTVVLVLLALAAMVAVVGLVGVTVTLARALARVRPEGRALGGSIAKVAVSIPAAGVGAIRHARGGRHTTLPARSLHGHAVAAGTAVVVVEVRRGTALVDALPHEFQESHR